jgi:hypothetical protein
MESVLVDIMFVNISLIYKHSPIIPAILTILVVASDGKWASLVPAITSCWLMVVIRCGMFCQLFRVKLTVSNLQGYNFLTIRHSLCLSGT